MLFTYWDAIDSLIDFQGGNNAQVSATASLREARASVIEAVHELAAAHNWSYYYRRLVFTMSAPYSTGTITYTHSTLQVALASGTWPSWAASGAVIIDNQRYDVDERVSDSVITLRSSNNPGANVAAGTAYVLFRDSYAVPSDFRALYGLRIRANAAMEYVPPELWADQQSRSSPMSGTPRLYTVIGGPQYNDGLHRVVFYPYPDQAYQAEAHYQRNIGEPTVDRYKTGTVTVGAASTALTGISTTWTSRLEGCLFRISSSTTEEPTGPVGDNPAEQESIVKTVGSATGITLRTAITTARTAVKYEISSPLDIPEFLRPCFRRLCEKSLAVKQNHADERKIVERATFAVRQAKEADHRNMQSQTAGVGTYPGIYWSDLPAVTNA